MANQPILFTHAFAPGGYDNRPLPALNQASPQINNPYMRRSSDKYQSFGTSVGKTTLGPYRMGGVTQIASAIYPGEYTPPNPRYIKPIQHTFENVAFNVSQPADRGDATNALVLKIGEIKQKYGRNEPFALYMAQQKLQREINDIERNGSITEVSIGREIMRNAVAQRRIQNEADMMRKLTLAGLNADDAQDEIDSLRRVDALQHTHKAGDREYQAKLLLTRIAKSRGVVSSINEPLNNHSAIIAPIANAKMASAMGQQEAGFGNSVLDVNRQFLTPEFYKRNLRKTGLTQESADRQTALNNLISSGGALPGPFHSGMLSGSEREQEIERHATSAMSRVEAMRRHGQKLMRKYPDIESFKEIMSKLGFKEDEKNRPTMFNNYNVEDMNMNELIVALNQLTLLKPSNAEEIKKLAELDHLQSKLHKDDYKIRIDDIIDIVRRVTEKTNGSHNILMPSIIPRKNLDNKDYRQALQAFLTNPSRIEHSASAARDYNGGELEEINPDQIPLHESSEIQTSGKKTGKSKKRGTRSMRHVKEDSDDGIVSASDNQVDYSKMTKPQLQAALSAKGIRPGRLNMTELINKLNE